ncbi:hypothetical protein JCM19039_3640 [Geomicrobium sp. JCM 19039]|nr:hypothetical protein JCM19039_3640 [Geomicrobium sp. JCM 19039]
MPIGNAKIARLVNGLSATLTEFAPGSSKSIVPRTVFVVSITVTVLKEAQMPHIFIYVTLGKEKSSF